MASWRNRGRHWGVLETIVINSATIVAASILGIALDAVLDAFIVDAVDIAAGSSGAESAMNGVRLAEQLTLESAESAFTAGGELSAEIPLSLGNPAIPQGFSKFTTETFRSPAGPFQVHFHMNSTTGEVFYGLDYKGTRSVNCVRTR